MKEEQFNLTFKWIGQATWILSIDDVKIACDPVLCPKDTVQVYALGMKGRRMTDPAYDAQDFSDIDFWLITHNHEDHLDKKGLEAISPRSKVITHKNAAKMLRRNSLHDVAALNAGQKITFERKNLSIEIEAIPAMHAKSFLITLFSGVNGYWITVRKDQARLQIYITGDTVVHKKVIQALSGRTADILIPFMGAAYGDRSWGPLTLNAKGLKKFVQIVEPRIILPVHFGTFSHLTEPVSALEALNDARMKIMKEGQTLGFTL